jgi:hypothetical protein
MKIVKANRNSSAALRIVLAVLVPKFPSKLFSRFFVIQVPLFNAPHFQLCTSLNNKQYVQVSKTEGMWYAVVAIWGSMSQKMKRNDMSRGISVKDVAKKT